MDCGSAVESPYDIVINITFRLDESRDTSCSSHIGGLVNIRNNRKSFLVFFLMQGKVSERAFLNILGSYKHLGRPSF